MKVDTDDLFSLMIAVYEKRDRFFRRRKQLFEPIQIAYNIFSTYDLDEIERIPLSIAQMETLNRSMLRFKVRYSKNYHLGTDEELKEMMIFIKKVTLYQNRGGHGTFEYS